VAHGVPERARPALRTVLCASAAQSSQYKDMDKDKDKDKDEDKDKDPKDKHEETKPRVGSVTSR